MAKTYLRTLLYLAQSTNFSELRQPGGEDFDVGDEGEQESEMLATMQADAHLLSLLQGFNDRQKIILMYQLLREAGYNLNHSDCAKTLSITRERYMVLLKDVKKRAAKILQIPQE
jgi:hypothetical protein